MGVIDRFLNAMKMNDDDDVLDDDYLDDDYDDDYDDDPEEELPKKRLLNRNRDDDSDRISARKEEPVREEPRRASASTQSPRQTKTKPARSNSSKISPMRSTGSSRRSEGMEVCVIRPKNMEDAREVTETLLDDCTVILNMEGIDFELAQRIIDFACGSCFAIHGKLQKVSNYIFNITPQHVDISGDFQEMMNGVYDVPSFGTSF
ncbi:MAG: cell division protein SepF [Lachnospiraceae bacterium]|nr:cell division protein SepF [Lachnospiraceae bacterium]